MASNRVDWSAFEKKYASYTVEVNAFLGMANVSKSTDVSIQNIYQAIRNDDHVDADLKILYHETIYGTNKEVKTCIRNRVANFRRTLRLHPKIKKIDMLHAPDYANMGLSQLETKLKNCEESDKKLSKAMEEESKCKRKQFPKNSDAEKDGSASDDNEASMQSKKPKIDDNNSDKEQAPDDDSAFDFFPKKAAMKESVQQQCGEDRSSAIKDNQKDFFSKGCNPTLSIELGDFIFSDDEPESNEAGDSVIDLRTYDKDRSFQRKKLIPRKKNGSKKDLPEGNDSAAKKDLADKNNLPQKKKSKAEEQFDLVINEAKSQDTKTSRNAEANQAQLTELMTSFDNNSANEICAQDNEMLQQLKKATDSVSKNSVEQTAYFRALGVKNNLNMEKYRSQVEKELQEAGGISKKSDALMARNDAKQNNTDIGQADLHTAKDDTDNSDHKSAEPTLPGDGLRNIHNSPNENSISE